MIVKSLARKHRSFTALLRYMHEGSKSPLALTHNLYSTVRTPWEKVADEFKLNSSALPARRGGNYLYHEILALERLSGVSKKEQGRMLIQVAKHYLKLRAPAQLAYGRLHVDDHVHLHLAISANRPRSPTRERLTKARFAAIQAQTEAFQIEHFPELGTDRIYGIDMRAERLQIRNAEYEAAKRQKVVPRKQQVRADLEEVVRRCKSLAQLKQTLSARGYSLYQRGTTWGVEEAESGRKHRLKSLGLHDEFQSALDRFSMLSRRQDELNDLHQQHALAHTNERHQNGGLDR